MFTPENEMGVVVYFAQEYPTAKSNKPIKLVSVQSNFPDAIVSVGNDQYRVEFEFIASNFIRHEHSILGCDLIVCWENDLGDFILPIVELKDSNWGECISHAIIPTYQEKELEHWKMEAARWKNKALRAGVTDIHSGKKNSNDKSWQTEAKRLYASGMAVSRIAREIKRNYYDTLGAIGSEVSIRELSEE